MISPSLPSLRTLLSRPSRTYARKVGTNQTVRGLIPAPPTSMDVAYCLLVVTTVVALVSLVVVPIAFGPQPVAGGAALAAAMTLVGALRHHDRILATAAIVGWVIVGSVLAMVGNPAAGTALLATLVIAVGTALVCVTVGLRWAFASAYIVGQVCEAAEAMPARPADMVARLIARLEPPE